MLNYAETARSSTIVPLVSQSQCQQNTTCPISLSYAIGPIDAAQIVTKHVHLSDGEEFTQLIPTHLPLSILNDPAFRDGYEWNFASEGERGEEEDWTSRVVKAYRARVRVYREQGKSFAEAQRLALVGNV